MSSGFITVRGAREHNLRDVYIELPREKLICITGLSGSGKSSLAFDTIYAEGQRRYVESLSAYARQFLGQMDKPDVDSIEGLSPAISIDQKSTSHNPRSTVGTVTEIHDYLRLLYARVGRPHCPECGKRIGAQSIEQMLDTVLALPENTRLMVLAPLVRGRKGEFQKLVEDVRSDGFTRLLIDGELRRVDEDIVLDKKFKHDIDVVVDRVVLREGVRRRLADSMETALRLADGLVAVHEVAGKDSADDGRKQQGKKELTEFLFSERFACADCGISLPELEPRVFSFNSPHGACPTCTGLGYQREVDPELLVADESMTIGEGALAIGALSGQTGGYYETLVHSVCDQFDVPMDVPWKKLSQEQRDLFMYGADGERVVVKHRTRKGRNRTYKWRFDGFVPHLLKRWGDTDSEQVRERIERFMRD